MRWFERSFLSIDLRTLGFTRVLLGVLLLTDLGKRAAGIGLWYTNEGLLPNHRVLWRPLREWGVSFLAALGSHGEVVIAFGLIGLVYLAFLVGYKTRVAHVLSWLCLLSLQVRVDLLSNGGDFVLCSLMLWTMLLPLGRRYSVDAAFLRLRSGIAGQAAPRDTPFVSLAVLAALTQLSVIYFFNAAHKTGSTWESGTAIHYLLYQERIVTAFAVWLRQHAALWLLQALAYGTIVVEYAAPFLILAPWGRPWTRRIAFLMLWGLHGGIALVSNLGLFSPTMMVFASLLLSAEDWDGLARWGNGSTFAARSARGVVSAVTHAVDRALYWLHGTAPCPPQASAGRAFAQRVVPWLREALVVALIVVATSQVLVENPIITRHVQVRQPRVLRAAVSYLRLNQGWSMFAPDAPRSDMTIVVDAVTADGRHVDPYNEAAARVADPSLRKVPERIGHDMFWCDYTVRVPGQRAYHDILSQWIMAYPERTGRPTDRIVGFDLYIVEQDSPAPGQSAPTNVRHRVMLRR